MQSFIPSFSMLQVEFTLERQVVVAAKTVQMTLTHKRPSDGHTLQSWTVSADVQTAADRQHVNLCLGLRHTDVTGAVHGLCAEVELAVPCGDMLLTLQDETLLRVRASWTVPADNCSSLHVGHLPITELAIVSAPSDDSRRQWHSGEGWPFAQCRQDAGNSSIPISMACLTAARQVASSGRLYSVYLTVSDVSIYATCEYAMFGIFGVRRRHVGCRKPSARCCI